MKIVSIASLALIALSACVVVPDEECYGDCYPDYGTIGFYWDFELYDTSITDDCALADVARVDIRIYDEFGQLEYSKLDCACGDAGYDLYDFYPGFYELQLTAYCPLRSVTHESTYEIEVYSGSNDFGSLTLDYLSECI